MAVKNIAARHDDARRRIAAALCTDFELEGMDLRVFLYMSSKIDFETFTHVSHVEMSVVLGKRRPHVSRSVKRLYVLGIIIPSEKGPRGSEWKLNAEFTDKRETGDV